MPTNIKNNISNAKTLIVNNDKIYAYNNYFYEFTSLNIVDADFCEITVLGEEFKYILQPNKLGVFTLNTYEYSRELFNYIDELDYNFSSFSDLNQSRYITFDIKIILFDSSEELLNLFVYFYNGVIQRWENPFVNPEVVNLSDIKMPYFVGYPFEYSNSMYGGVLRYLVSDGSYVGSDPNVRNIDKECDGIYLKWHNSKYGYSYYLFGRISKEKFSVRTLGSVSEQFSTTDNLLDIGKVGVREIDVFANVIYEDRELMKSLAKSNEIYLYTGNKYDIATREMWLQVKVDRMRVVETNKNNTFDQRITIKLPVEKTRTRI